MVTYEIEKLSPTRYKCSALEGAETLVYASYILGKDSSIAIGVEFVHFDESVDFDIIKELSFYIFQHLNSLGVKSMKTLPTKNPSVLYLFMNIFNDVIFYDANNKQVNNKIIEGMSYNNSFNCSDNNIKNGIVTVIPIIDKGD